MTFPSLDLPPGACQVAFLDPIPDVIPFCSLTYMAGASGSGKTIMMAEWLARLRDGRTICGHPTNPPTEICYIAADRDWSTYAKAFAHAGFPNVRRYVLAEDPDFDPKAWKRGEAFKFLDRCLTKLNPLPGALVVIDPISPLFVQGKTNDNWDVAISSLYYRVLCRQYQITMICMANVAKQRTDDTYMRPQDRISGSGSFVAYSDTQIYLQRDEDNILTLGLVPRCAKAEEFQFYFNETTHLFVPFKPSTTTIGLPAHLAPILDLIPHPPATITSPNLVRLLMEKRKIKRSHAFKSIAQLIERGTIERDDLGVIRRKDLDKQPVPPSEPTEPSLENPVD